MEEYKLSPWGDHYKENAEIIHSIARQIRASIKRLLKREDTEQQARVMFKNIIRTLQHWTGYTYIGLNKESVLEEARCMP